MLPFKLLKPTSFDEAIQLLTLDPDHSKPIAGGTALMLMMKSQIFTPTQVISLRNIKDSSYIKAEPNSELKTVTEQVISSTIVELDMSTATLSPYILEKSIDQKLEKLKLEHQHISELEDSLHEKLKREIMKQEQLKTDFISEGNDETMNEKTLGMTKSLTESIVTEMTEQQTVADTTLTEKEIYDQSTVGDVSFDHHDEPPSTASLEAAVDFLVEKLVKIVRDGSFE